MRRYLTGLLAVLLLLCITAAFLLYSFIIYMKTYYHMLKKEKDSLPDHP